MPVMVYLLTTRRLRRFCCTAGSFCAKECRDSSDLYFRERNMANVQIGGLSSGLEVNALITGYGDIAFDDAQFGLGRSGRRAT